MPTDENNNNQDRTQENLSANQSDSQGQNNNGNIGREEGLKEEGNGSFKNITTGLDSEKPVNETGLEENQEQHWVGNHGQQSSNRPGSHHSNDYSDQNLTNGAQQNSGRNHVTNAGGTSQEDLEDGKTGFTNEENNS